MRLELEKVRFKNFFSYGAKFQELEFKRGINLILGYISQSEKSNGSGKTNLIESIPFALFGKVHKEVNQNQIINWKNKKNCEVQLYFSIGDDNYIINRALKPNILEIYKNEKLENEFSDKRDYQKWIEDEIINIDFNTFISLIHLNMNNYGSILGMTKTHKRDFISRLFNLHLYSDLNDIANKKINILNDKINELKYNIQSNNKIIKYHKEQITKTKNKLINFDSYDNKEQNIKNKIIEYEQKLNKINNKQIEIFNKNIIEEEKNKYKEKEKELYEYKEKKAKIEALKDDSIKKYNKIKGESICPLCWSKIDINEIKTNIDNDNKERNIEINNLNNIINNINNKLKNINNIILEYKNKYESNKKEIEEKNNKIQLNNIKLNEYKNEYKLIKEKIKLDNKQKQELLNDIKTHNKEIIKIEDENKNNKIKLNNLYKINDYMEYIKNICKDNAVKQYAITSIVPYINKQMNYYLAEIGQSFYVKLDKWLNATINGPGIHDGSYGNLSGGEIKSVDLSCQQSLLDVAKIQSPIFPSILLYDELLDSSLDDGTIAKLWEIVKLKQNEDKSSVYIISHKKEIKEMNFSNVIEIIKENGFSKIIK